MAKIKVHVLNFHGLFSHIELVLENMSVEPREYYAINRWEMPGYYWRSAPKAYIEQASSTFSFDIEANPDEIQEKWQQYHYDTAAEASILGKNCAVAAQWFLTNFANIPKPNLSNISWNHLALGLVWPSFIPCPVTLPGRVMSNAKFYIEATRQSQVAKQYSHLFLYAMMGVATLIFSASIFGLAVAATVLSGGIAAVAIAGLGAVALASTYGFFKAHNTLSLKHIADKAKKDEDSLPLCPAALNP